LWWHDVCACMTDTGGYRVGVVIPDRRRKRPDTDGYRCRCRTIHGATSQLYRGQSSGMLSKSPLEYLCFISRLIEEELFNRCVWVVMCRSFCVCTDGRVASSRQHCHRHRRADTNCTQLRCTSLLPDTSISPQGQNQQGQHNYSAFDYLYITAVFSVVISRAVDCCLSLF